MSAKEKNGSLNLEEGSIFDTKEELFEARGLFSKHYLEKNRETITRGIKNNIAEEAFRNCRDIYERAYKANRARFSVGGLNESDTEGELIDKILPILGFHFLHRTRQDVGGVPDYILFSDKKTKDEAFALDDRARYRHAIGILEAKSINKNLSAISKKETPGTSYAKQVWSYLSDAQPSREKSYFEWAILTNGHHWRLYCLRADRTKYFSIDLKSALNNIEDFKFFFGLFRSESFLPDLQGSLLLERLRMESDTHQRELEQNLQRRIYVLVEWIAQGFIENEFNKNKGLTLDRVYKTSLILLYRLMFVLYAEARNLLPVKTTRRLSRVEYLKDYSLQRFIPWLLENDYQPEDDPLEKYWRELVSLFEVIDGKNEKVSQRLEITRYNGGLFDPDRHHELVEWRLGAWTVQETLKRLMFDVSSSSIRETIPIGSSETLDYSELNVKQLGSIYEGLLEHHLVLENGKIKLKADNEERWKTGSYYTPDWVVDYILEETLRPLLDEIEKSEAVSHAKTAKIEDNSFAKEVLKLKILDPAMGSGHFLVGATEFLAEEIANHPTTITAVTKPSYGLTPDEAERAYWLRKVVESSIYGVDKNELAVELAKLSLWLTCISPDRPLSFLDHHLKPGDSLTGTHLDKIGSKYRVIGLPEIRTAAADALTEISNKPSDSYDDVKKKELILNASVTTKVEPFEAVLDRYSRQDFEVKPNEAALAADLEKMLENLGNAKRDVTFQTDWPLHYELAFPDVFPPEAQAVNPPGLTEEQRGFDAVIGNPPYVRQETLGELKRYLQRNYQTYQGTADLYVYFVERGMNLLREGGRFGMIFSNKWMRASYGGALRDFIRKKQIEKIVDFGELKVFASSSTFPMIMTARNETPSSEPLYAAIREVPIDVNVLNVTVKERAFQMGKEGLAITGFALVKKEMTDIFEKMKSVGKPLGEYVENKMYFGLKTSFNQAFVISAEERERLIRKDAKSAEIIVPWVVGNDVRKWRVNYRNRYLILTKIGVGIEEYPAVFEHLKIHQEALENRSDKGNYWWEFRSCNYYDEFKKPKIVWPDIAKESRFAFDESGAYFDATCFIMPVANFFLLGLLNSKAVWSYLLRHTSVLGDPDKGGRIRQKRQYMIHIPTSANGNKDKIASFALSALEIKDKLNSSAGLAETRRLEKQLAEVEAEIDMAVYQLYGLTQKEITILEGKG